MTKLKIAIIGMGGFAQAHHRAALRLEEKGRCQLVCTCDPDPNSFTQFRREMRFEIRNTKVYSDYIEMLDAHAGDLDVVTIPTPVPLHKPMHKACVDRGLAVYLEKPPTLNGEELEEMLATEAEAERATNVGFNFIVERARRDLKKRVLDGEFGALRRASFYAVWPRGPEYYGRAPWAGRLLQDDRLVLDSCMGNACSHYVHNLLFWAGTEMDGWGRVKSTTAELYRAHPIQSFDTVFAKGLTEDNVQLRLAITHGIVPGARHPSKNEEMLECEKARILYTPNAAWQVLWHDGRREFGTEDMDASTAANFQAYFDYINGKACRPVTRLCDCVAFVEFYNQVFLAAGRITTIGDQQAEERGWLAGDGIVGFDEIAHAVIRYYHDGFFPSEMGYGWSGEGGTARPANLPKLRQTIDRLAAEAETAGREQ